MYSLHGETDIKRQAPNVFKMKLLGADIVPVKSDTDYSERRNE